MLYFEKCKIMLHLLVIVMIFLNYKVSYIIFFCWTILFHSTSLFSQPKQEVRAVWLTTVYNIDWPSSSSLSATRQQAEMCAILDSLKSANFNTIMFQVRARGDLLFPSAIEPWGRSVSGTLGHNPGYNVLQFVINEAHQRGIEVHAWFVVYKVSDGQSVPPATLPQHVVRAHPEWCKLYNENGNYSWWLDPGIPQVTDYLTSIVMETVRNYNIDGIHFDYIRYPDTDFDDAATFSMYGNGMTLANWRRNNINQFVYQVYDSIMSVKPDMKVGSAPIGIYKKLPHASGWQGYFDIYQDSRNWLAQGKLDYICPQIYWDIANPPSDPAFPVLVSDWVNNASQRHVYTGIAAYRMSPKEKSLENNSKRYRMAKNNWTASEILHEIDTARALGSLGQIFFSNNEICSNLKNIYTQLKNGQYHYPANIPSMPWKDHIPPLPVQNLTITRLDSINYFLSWNPPITASDGDTVKYYNVYSDDNSPVDIFDIKKITNFQLMHTQDALITLQKPPTTSKKFTVTAYDNGYNESTPAAEVNTAVCKYNAVIASNWQTNDFTAIFSDSAFLRVDKRFYLVSDFNGQQWKANANYGFFYDNFQTSLNPEWHNISGSWDTLNGALHQADQANGNTNIYANLNQSYQGSYLYQWRMNISKTGTNRRVGLHFLCSDPMQENRGNSYLIYFRADNNKVQIYKYAANNMFLATDDVCDVTSDTWYDCKVIYQAGEISVFVNNHLVSSWTDSIPLQTGTAISFRTGESSASFDDFKVYRSRNLSEKILAGDTTKEIRFQNMNPSTPAGRILSVTTTAKGYFSAIASHDVNVDCTPPLPFFVYDGNAKDVDTIAAAASLTGVWTNSADSNSGIVKYMVAFGTSQGDSDLVAWTDANLDTAYTANNLNLQNNYRYFCSVKAINASGLFQKSTSDGVRVILAPLADFSVTDTIICAGNLVTFSNTSENADMLQWTFEGGYPEMSFQPNPIVLYDTAGVFNVALEVEGSGGYDTIRKQGYIHVNSRPHALFTINDSILALPTAIAAFKNLSAHASSYYWDFGDGATSTDENPWHQYFSAGDYSVTLIAYYTDCGVDTIVKKEYIHVMNTNFVAGNAETIFLNVIPNPLNERAIVYYETQSDAVISITLADILGKEIILQKNKFVEQGIHIVSLGSIYPYLSEGIYFIKLTADNKTSVIKITK